MRGRAFSDADSIDEVGGGAEGRSRDPGGVYGLGRRGRGGRVVLTTVLRQRADALQ